jgi:hypothetical protein
MDCYIYYKSQIEHAAAIRHCVGLLCAELTGKLNHLPRLQRRPAASDGLITWMEIYLDVSEDFEQILNEAVAKCGMQTLIHGERRLEYFVYPSD